MHLCFLLDIGPSANHVASPKSVELHGITTSLGMPRGPLTPGPLPNPSVLVVRNRLSQSATRDLTRIASVALVFVGGFFIAGAFLRLGGTGRKGEGGWRRMEEIEGGWEADGGLFVFG